MKQFKYGNSSPPNISSSVYIDSDNNSSNYNYPYPAPNSNTKPPIFQRNWFIILMLLFISPAGIFLMWYFKEWKTITKVIISIFFIFYFTIYCGVLS